MRRMTVLGCLWFAVANGSAGPIGTGITYQGRLLNGGVPADGPHNLSFTLWDAPGAGNPPVGGVQIGVADAINNVDVVEGLFSVEINTSGEFGASAFNGQARWLQVAVNGTPLGPRQPLTAAPYALYALDGPGSGNFWANNGNNIYKTNSGHVGINTTAPGVPLHVMGGTDINLTSGGFIVMSDGANDSIGLDQNEIMARSAGNPSTLFMNHQGGNVVISAAGTGNLGVGVTPGARLDVDGRGRFRQGASSSAGLWFHQNTPNQDRGFVGMRNDDLIGFYGPAGAGWAFTMDVATGNVGVGIEANDYAKLDVLGDDDGVSGQASFGLVGEAGDSDGWGGVFLGADGFGFGKALWCVGDAEFWAEVYCQHRVGIATENPNARLHVVGDGETVAYFQQFGADPGVSISMFNGSSNYSALTVYSASSNAPALSVNGVASVDVLEVYGADIAEKFPVSDAERLEPGTVVEIDAANPGKLCTARGEYNRRVAGVVSGAGDVPVGAVLGQLTQGEDAHAIALTGRVWVKCDAASGAIEPGDLLTTSASAGHAMRVTDFTRSQGAIIGKAMTSLARGERGLVLVLVSLQ